MFPYSGMIILFFGASANERDIAPRLIENRVRILADGNFWAAGILLGPYLSGIEEVPGKLAAALPIVR